LAALADGEQRKTSSSRAVIRRRRKQLVHAFMRDFTNYVRQDWDRNQRLGRGIGLTYDGVYPDRRYRGDNVTVLPGGERLRTTTPTP
jgi:hypothetical protein